MKRTERKDYGFVLGVIGVAVALAGLLVTITLTLPPLPQKPVVEVVGQELVEED